MSTGALLVLMGGLFLGLGYMGVPVAFAIMAGVLAATAFTPVSFAAMIGQPGAATRAVLLLNGAADALQRATDAGTGFVFGYLAGPPLPFVESHPGASFILAFKALPLEIGRAHV